ncbi:MAG: DUF3298 domain-containing protein [Oscillibacter sp.]|nr:DUF3298 domain-containing protein [Oscillibacter sp.]
MMKRILITRFPYLAVLFSLLLVLTACSSSADSGPSSAAESPAPAETPADPAVNLDAPTEENATLESLCGVDYQSYLVDTITMQMENRMEKTPEVVYFPIEDDKPLTDYAAIDETTSFTVDEEGNIVIHFPAGTVTDESHGEQTFIMPKP